jgi:DNA-dependent RNA polymerase auxiliary subunit epsilon
VNLELTRGCEQGPCRSAVELLYIAVASRVKQKPRIMNKEHERIHFIVAKDLDLKYFSYEKTISNRFASVLGQLRV